MTWIGPHGIDEADKLEAAETRAVVRRSLALLRPYRVQALLAAFLLIVTTLGSLVGPWILRYGIDNGLTGAHPRRAALSAAALAYLISVIATLILSRAQVRLVGYVGEKFLRDLRDKVFSHIVSLSVEFFDGEPTGKLVGRMTADIDALQDLVQLGVIQFIQNGLSMLFLLGILLVLSWQLGLICLVGVPFVFLASRRFKRESNRAYLIVRDRVSHTMSALQEGLAGVRVVQAFAQEDRQLTAFLGRNRSQLDANLNSAMVQARFLPLVEFAGSGTTAAVLGVGGYLVHRGDVSLGTVSAFVLYLVNLFDPVQQLSQLLNTVQSAAAALNKLFGLLDTKATLVEPRKPLPLPARGIVDVRDVSFTYAGTSTPVLRNVSLVVGIGERLALVGPTGAGKSTLAKLIGRLYDPTAGSIEFGGIDLRDTSGDLLRQHIVVVPQEGHLFGGSVLDNIRFADPSATEQQALDALELIGAADRFTALPDGIHTQVWERGSRLSAGERQLVSLARAALVNASVLVLDEATSNVDPGTEARINDAMDRLMAGRTVLVIAHRLSTAEVADRVAVVADGGIAELGTHTELLALGGRYAALHASWVSALSTDSYQPEATSEASICLTTT